MAESDTTRDTPPAGYEWRITGSPRERDVLFRAYVLLDVHLPKSRLPLDTRQNLLRSWPCVAMFFLLAWAWESLQPLYFLGSMLATIAIWSWLIYQSRKAGMGGDPRVTRSRTIRMNLDGMEVVAADMYARAPWSDAICVAETQKYLVVTFRTCGTQVLPRSCLQHPAVQEEAFSAIGSWILDGRPEDLSEHVLVRG